MTNWSRYSGCLYWKPLTVTWWIMMPWCNDWSRALVVGFTMILRQFFQMLFIIISSPHFRNNVIIWAVVFTDSHLDTVATWHRLFGRSADRAGSCVSSHVSICWHYHPWQQLTYPHWLQLTVRLCRSSVSPHEDPGVGDTAKIFNHDICKFISR